MAASKTFAEAMSKVPEKVFKKAKEVQPGGTFEVPKIEDGKYKAHWKKGECGIGSAGKVKGVPFVRIIFEVFDSPDYDGVKLEKYHSIKNFEADLERIVKTFKGIGYEFSDDLKAKDLEDLVNDGNANPPDVMLTVRNGEYEKDGKMVPKVEVYTDRPLATEELNGHTKAAKKPAKRKK